MVGARLRESSVAVSSGGRSGATDVSAVPSDREKWGEREIEMIIRMKAERVKFQYIAVRPILRTHRSPSTDAILGRPAQGCACGRQDIIDIICCGFKG